MADYANPEDPYWAFFEAFNAKDRRGWADVMSYPHVRVSARGNVGYYDTPEEYAERAAWESIEATGWVRTQGMEPVRLHASSDKVHLAAGWTRYNADGDPILSNRVTYIVTLVDGSWGIQARFGTDFLDEDDSRESAESAVGAVSRLLDSLDAGDAAECARLVRYPFTVVGIGEVQQLQDDEAFGAWLPEAQLRGGPVREVRAAQIGTGGVNVSVTCEAGSGGAHVLYLVAKGEGVWHVAGYSDVSS